MKGNIFRMKKFYFLLCLLCVLAVLFIYNHTINSRDISSLSNALPQPTVIYDRQGEVASKISGSKIKGVKTEELPAHVLLAVIAIEDHRFYKHPGVDYIGIMRALVKNVKAGEIVEGGSTITQQLTKNVFLTHEQTFERKLEEFFLAQKIERKYSKDEILEMYLNQIYFGEGAWGIQGAALTYFGKDAGELTLSEAATIAGIIKAPSTINPYINPEKALERRNLVLSMMKNNEFITKSEFDKAIEEQLVVKRSDGDPYEGKFPYYVDYIIEEAIEKYGLTQNEILHGGLHIYTQLDQEMQTAVEEVYRNDELFPESPTENLVQSGTVLMNAKTGGVLALVGGRGEHVFRGFNRATQLERQPGSTMKPLAVYTPALEKGYNMYSVLEDRPVDFNGYKPTNYNGSYKGSVTLLEAIRSSDNVPAVWLLNEIGLRAGIDAVERFGLPITENDHNLPLALGGLDKGVAPIDMAEAYSVFANEGVRAESHAIVKIVDSNGDVVIENDGEEIQVTSSEVADAMTFMLHQVVEQGTGRNAKLDGHELAGKTGSTQVPIDGVDGTKDHWFVGYTPEIVGATWLGYDKTDEKHFLTTSSSATVTFIFKEIMEKSLANVQATSFNLPTYQQPKPVYNNVQTQDQRQNQGEEQQQQKQNKNNHKQRWEERWNKGNGNGNGRGNGNGNGRWRE